MRLTVPLPRKTTFTAAWVYRGIASTSLGRYDAALDSFDHAISLDPACALTQLHRGIALIRLDRSGRSGGSIRPCPCTREQQPGCILLPGHCAHAAGKFEKPLASFDNAIALNDRYAQVFHHKGIALARIQRYDDAIKEFDAALMIQPEYDRGAV